MGLARSWEEAHTASPFKSESKTHRVAGQKLNFKPVRAASQAPSALTALTPGWGEKERGWPGQEKLSCHHRSVADGEGQRRPRPPSEEEAGKSRARRQRRCAPSPSAAAGAPRCPFGRGQLLAAAAPPPCAPAQATPGCASSAPGRPPEQPQPYRPSFPRAGTNFLPLGPAGCAGWQAAPSPGFPGLRCRRPRPAWRASSLPLSNGELPPCPSPTPSPGRLPVSAPPLQQSRRPRGDRARGWEWQRGRQSPAKASLGRASAACRDSGDVAGRERGRKYPALRANAFYARFRSSSLALLPLPERVRLSRWELAGAEREAEGTQWPGGRAAPLPLSRVSGWTTVNVAMSAVGAEVTLGFSISNRL